MFLSKIWFVLVGLAASVAATAAFVAPRSADRRIVQLEGQRLDRAQYAAEQMLKADAHSWIDYVSKLSRDANLAESLDAASKASGEPKLLHETVHGRLRTLVPDRPGIGLVTVGAVDAKGRLIARLGEREREFGESVAGIEVISDALRGYLSDDVWGAGGRLQRVAAVPVLSRGRDRIVGALWVGAETGKRLAEVWKQNLGVDIAILLRGQVTSSTVNESFLSALAGGIDERKQEIASSKRTRPITLTVGSDRLLAVAAPFVGQASEQGGYYALIGTMSPATDPLALLKNTKADELKWGNFPWLGLALGLIVMLGVGLMLQRMEVEKPLTRLRAEVQRLARGEIQKLDDTVHHGKLGGIARDVNAAMERYTLAPPPRSESARKDVGAILGPAPMQQPPPQPASVFDLPQSHFDPLGDPLRQSGGFADPRRAPGAPPSAFGSAPPSFASPGSPFAPPPAPEIPLPSPSGLIMAPPAREASPPRGYGGPPTLSAAAQLGATPERRLMSPQMGAGRPPPPPQDSLMNMRRAEAVLQSEAPAQPEEAGGPTGIGLPAMTAMAALERPLTEVEEAPRTAMFSPGQDNATAVASTSAPGEDAEGEDAPATSIAPVNGDLGDASEDRAYTAHIREVFEAYVATRRRCGETVNTLTLDKFQARLETNRQQLVAKYGCRSARFSVYVKDGKAAVKATPLR